MVVKDRKLVTVSAARVGVSQRHGQLGRIPAANAHRRDAAGQRADKRHGDRLFILGLDRRGAPTMASAAARASSVERMDGFMVSSRGVG